jgi:hypothetical protein
MNDEKPARTIGHAAALGLAHMTAETATTRTFQVDGQTLEMKRLDDLHERLPKHHRDAVRANPNALQEIADHNAYVANRQARRAYERAFAKRNAAR